MDVESAFSESLLDALSSAAVLLAFGAAEVSSDLGAGLLAGTAEAGAEAPGAEEDGAADEFALLLSPAGVELAGVDPGEVPDAGGVCESGVALEAGGDDSESVGSGFFATAEGLFKVELSQPKPWPFQRRYPNPTARARAMRIRKTFPAPPPWCSSSSSSR